MTEIDDLRGRYSAERITRLVKLATSGGDIEKPLRAVVRSIAPLGPPGEYLRDELAHARRAAKRRDSEGSIGRLVDLTRWTATHLRVPELACMLSAVAMNVRNDIGTDVRAEDSAALDYIAGKLAFDFLDYETASIAWARALETAEATEGRDLVPDLLLNLGNVARFQDRNEDATRLVRAAADEYERQADVTGHAQALLSLGYMAADANEFDKVAHWLAAVEPLLKGRQSADTRSGFHHLRAVLHVEAGEYALAETSFKRSLAAARRSGDHDKVVTALQNLAAVASDVGNASLSLRRTRAATEAASEHRLLLRLTALLPTLVRAEAAHGSHAASLSAARALLEVAVATDHGVGEAHALLGASLIDNNLAEEGLAELEHAWELLRGDSSHPAVQVRPHIINNLIVAHSNAGTLDQSGSCCESTQHSWNRTRCRKPSNTSASQ
jgi:tetratricopeptide (TPR) repeat protein